MSPQRQTLLRGTERWIANPSFVHYVFEMQFDTHNMMRFILACGGDSRTVSRVTPRRRPRAVVYFYTFKKVCAHVS